MKGLQPIQQTRIINRVVGLMRDNYTCLDNRFRTNFHAFQIPFPVRIELTGKYSFGNATDR